MGLGRIFAVCLLLACMPAGAGAGAGSYDQPASRGARWISGQQNPDGSWGASVDIQPLYTAEAVRALSAAYNRKGPYYAGLAWLESQADGNVDSAARRIGALAVHGDDLSFPLSYLQSAQSWNGTAYSGWGLSPFYTSSAIDTALALMACAELGNTAQVQPALDFLKNTQRTGSNDKGWAVGSVGNSDPAATALSVQALVRFKTLDTALSSRIANAVATLAATVDGSAAPTLQALAAQASIDAGDSPASTLFLKYLTDTQAVDGSWGGDFYATALATRALATAANLATQGALVQVPDQALRQAINLELGRNAMDKLTRGDLAQLTSLAAAGLGIADLTGLEWATNLVSADLRNNNIASTAPLGKLSRLANRQFACNPVAPNNLTVAYSGMGSVTSDPAGTDCGAAYGQGYENNVVVVLTEVPVPGYTFTGWSGDCVGAAATCALSMGADKSVTANFFKRPLSSWKNHLALP